ncbi:MAG: hypothetical protein WDO69_14545 [Pseudomonadota bacterium]
MKRRWLKQLEHRAALGAVLAFGIVACGNGTASSSGENESGGSAGATPAQGGRSIGGSSSSAGEATSTGGAKPIAGSGGTSGSAGGSVSGAGGDGAAGSGNGGAFTCNLLIGNSTTQQWFEAGFLNYAGIDPTHWESYWVAHHYLDAWADPSDAAWNTPFDMDHACAVGSMTPDRVIFVVTFAPPYPAESTYQTDLTSIVDNIEAKYPTVARIELVTLIRAPDNSATACSSATSNEQSIPDAEDQAIAAVASDPMFVGLVSAPPPTYVPSCADFLTDKPQYTTAGAQSIAAVYGAYYAAHP